MKLKIGYRVEVSIKRGLLHRSKGHFLWEKFESDLCSGIGKCVSEQKARKLYDELCLIAFKSSKIKKAKWGRI